MPWARSAQRWLALAFQVGVVVQFFLAGIGVFYATPKPGEDHLFDSSKFDAHRTLGDVMVAVAILLLVLAALGRQRVRLSAVLLVLMIVQFVLAAAGDGAPVIAALHPVNGLALLGVSHVLWRMSVQAPGAEARPAGPQAEPL